MSLPRLPVEIALPELSAIARMRAALYAEVAEKLPVAMRARIAGLGSSGELRAAVQQALATALAAGFPAEDALVVAVTELLYAEATQVQEALLAEVRSQLTSASKMDQALRSFASEESPRPAG